MNPKAVEKNPLVGAKPSLYSLTYSELEQWLIEAGEKSFRAKQLYDLSLIHISEPTRRS